MARCDTIVETVDGIVNRCQCESAKGSSSCYLHAKYWAGLCEPVRSYNDGKEQREDEVKRIMRDKTGDMEIKTYV